MTTHLPRIIHLATTDADFCAALQADPQTALAERGLEANANELASLVELRSLIATLPQILVAQIPKGPGWMTLPSVSAPAA